jgi:hypothetical protein
MRLRITVCTKCSALNEQNSSTKFVQLVTRRSNRMVKLTDRWLRNECLLFCFCFVFKSPLWMLLCSFFGMIPLDGICIGYIQVKRRWVGKFRPFYRPRRPLGRVEVYIYSVLDLGTRRGWGISVTPRPHSTPRIDTVPIVQGAGWAPGLVWTGTENLASAGIWSPGRPASRCTNWATRPTS